MSPSEPALSFKAFVREVLDALEAAHVTYLIGGAVAMAAWCEARTTRDLDLVIELPIESMASLSLELERRNMLVPVDIMLDRGQPGAPAGLPWRFFSGWTLA